MKSIRKWPHLILGCFVAGAVLLLIYLDATQINRPGRPVTESIDSSADITDLTVTREHGLHDEAPNEQKMSSVTPFRSLRITPRGNILHGAQLLPAKLRTTPTNAPILTLSPFCGDRLPSRNSDIDRASTEAHSSTVGSAEATDPASEPKQSELQIALGAGLDKLPRWQGSRKTELRRVPYIDINWLDRIELSTVKGLTVDLVHGEKWHGGLIGTMVWGRSAKDLDGLKVPTLINTLQGGLYLEYAMASAFSVGVRLRHDIQNTGVSYAEAYVELELPKIGYLEHDIHISQEAMNRAGMHRFFGLSAEDATKLGVSAYAPRAGLNKASITYEGFHPTSESTGLVFGATIGRLNSEAANSPLVKHFGAAIQREFFGAFLYHF